MTVVHGYHRGNHAASTDPTHFIVCWMTVARQDHWQVFDNRHDAFKKYNLLLEDAFVYTASVTTVVASTDYEGAPHAGQ